MLPAWGSGDTIRIGDPATVNRMYPQIQESGPLEIVSPPETRDDLEQFPGALTLTFTDQVVNGIAHEPIGIAAGYSQTFNGNWLGGEQPYVSVLYRVKGP